VTGRSGAVVVSGVWMSSMIVMATIVKQRHEARS
jgi:hypothetical protein